VRNRDEDGNDGRGPASDEPADGPDETLPGILGYEDGDRVGGRGPEDLECGAALVWRAHR
jgi:hypothetical protein